MGIPESINVYSTANATVFVSEVHDLIKEVNAAAENSGIDLEITNTRYAVAKVHTDWVVVLTIFSDNCGRPTQFSASAPIQ